MVRARIPAYNLTVGQTHTYTVDFEQLWAHNDCDKNLDLDKTDRIKENVCNGELDAARREKLGEVVAVKKDGTPWDHVSELEGAQNGLLNQIKKLKKELSKNNLDSASRKLIEQKLSEASKILDKTEEYLSR